MTTDYALDALKSLINNADTSEYKDLSSIDVFVTQEDGVKSYPCITIEDNGASEHEILRGVLDPLLVEVKWISIPNESEDDGTTEEKHKSIATQIYELLGSTWARQYLDAYTNLKVFDIRGNEPANEREEGRNTTTFNLEIVCCRQN